MKNKNRNERTSHDSGLLREASTLSTSQAQEGPQCTRKASNIQGMTASESSTPLRSRGQSREGDTQEEAGGKERGNGDTLQG